MKITIEQIRRIIREASRYTSVERGMAGSYQAGYKDGEAGAPPKKTKDPEYLRGYEKGVDSTHIDLERFDKYSEVRRQDDYEDTSPSWYDDEAGYETLADKKFADSQIREVDGFTKKYDDDSALKGKQSKLPDALQKGIIDKTVEDREEDEEKEVKNESLRRRIREIIEDETGYTPGVNPEEEMEINWTEERLVLISHKIANLEQEIEKLQNEKAQLEMDISSSSHSLSQYK